MSSFAIFIKFRLFKCPLSSNTGEILAVCPPRRHGKETWVTHFTQLRVDQLNHQAMNVIGSTLFSGA